jgi:rhodanese-related sulfurtransferase
MGYKTIERDQLKAWVGGKKDFVLVNVLSKESFDDKHLPGSIHADVADESFLEKMEYIVPDKNKPVVVYCRAGNTSPKAAEKLTNTGYTDVYDYKGGTNDWEEGRLLFEKS